jgi:hypothetical protein
MGGLPCAILPFLFVLWFVSIPSKVTNRLHRHRLLIMSELEVSWARLHRQIWQKTLNLHLRGTDYLPNRPIALQLNQVFLFFSSCLAHSCRWYRHPHCKSSHFYCKWSASLRWSQSRHSFCVVPMPISSSALPWNPSIWVHRSILGRFFSILSWDSSAGPEWERKYSCGIWASRNEAFVCLVCETVGGFPCGSVGRRHYTQVIFIIVWVFKW